MAYNKATAERIRQLLAGREGVTEKSMFGGYSFLLHGKMGVGILGEDLVVRVKPEDAPALLDDPSVRPMDFTGRAMKGFVYVAPEGYASDVALQEWLERGMSVAQELAEK
jgi:TfoX/Sxy family transcriptional regulator of competence genes